MADYDDLYWWSADGIRLHARDYREAALSPAGSLAGGDDAQLPVICLPGLTRNARDYVDLAKRIAGKRRVLAVDFRGRGESGYAKDPMSYVPLTYAQDVIAMLGEAGIGRFVAVGTSLGGIVTMLLAGMLPGRIAGAVLNDVGPDIEPAGLSRIRGYVGRSSNWPTWMHAARWVQEANADIYPDWGVEQWLAMAKRLYRLNSSGRIVLDYDLKIAEPFRLPGNEAGPDMWRALSALAGVPVLMVRGGRSDVLSAATAQRMVEALPAGDLVTLPGIGHAPTLNEPALQGAIDRLLVKAGQGGAEGGAGR